MFICLSIGDFLQLYLYDVKQLEEKQKKNIFTEQFVSFHLAKS